MSLAILLHSRLARLYHAMPLRIMAGVALLNVFIMLLVIGSPPKMHPIPLV